MPVIYENPRFDTATPTLKPVFDRAMRAGLVLMLEWGSLTVIESAPPYLKWATVVIAILGLAVHESWPWLRMRHRLWYPGLMAGLVLIYAGLFGYAVFSEPPSHTTPVVPAFPAASAVSLPSLHEDAAKWRMVKSLHALSTTEHGPIKGTCEVVVVRYQLPYAENIFLDLKDIFDVIDWKYHEAFASSTLPRGLSIKSVQGDVSSDCMSLFREQLSNNTSRVTASNSFVEKPKEDEHMKLCSGPCFEIDIGNEQ
jgi:hypothetical protein